MIRLDAMTESAATDAPEDHEHQAAQSYDAPQETEGTRDWLPTERLDSHATAMKTMPVPSCTEHGGW